MTALLTTPADIADRPRYRHAKPRRAPKQVRILRWGPGAARSVTWLPEAVATAAWLRGDLTLTETAPDQWDYLSREAGAR